jgi:hypothetical protein
VKWCQCRWKDKSDEEAKKEQKNRLTKKVNVVANAEFEILWEGLQLAPDDR